MCQPISVSRNYNEMELLGDTKTETEGKVGVNKVKDTCVIKRHGCRRLKGKGRTRFNEERQHVNEKRILRERETGVHHERRNSSKFRIIVEKMVL